MVFKEVSLESSPKSTSNFKAYFGSELWKQKDKAALLTCILRVSSQHS